MIGTSACPDVQGLQRFVLGQLPDPEAARVEQHLSECGRCLEALQTLKKEDTLVEEIRAQGVAAGEPTNTVVEGLVDRFSRLPEALGSNAGPTAAYSSPRSSSEEGTATPATLPPPAAATEEVYDFLAPPEGPGEIGRLGGYRVLKVLGVGGMGVVFQAEDPHLQRLVALKVIRPALAASSLARQRFLREARTTAALEHDHVVHINQVGEDRGVPFLAMPLLKGETLDDRLRREGRLSLPEVLRVGREIAEGLAAAHERGLVHRDIKPSNVWLEGTRARVKILDFGLARAVEGEGQLTQSGVIAGTPAYMAPEQASGEAVDHRCDLFSLGCVLYRMATGQVPFKGSSTLAVLRSLAIDDPRPPREVNPEVPPALSDLIGMLLSKDPAGRPASAQAVAETLQALKRELPAAGSVVVLPPAGVTQPEETVQLPSSLTRPARRRWGWWVAAAVLLLGLGVGGALFGPAVYRIATDRGQLVIETDDPEVEVVVKQGGQQVKILDPKSGKEVTLKAGSYQLELAPGKEGLTLSANQFTLQRGGKEVVRVRLEAPGSGPAAAVAGIHPAAEPTGAVRRLVGHTGPVASVLFLPDGQRALSCGWDGTVRLWDVASGRQLRVMQGHTDVVQGLALSRDGRLAVSGGWDGTARVWDLETGKERQRFTGHQGTVTSVALFPDGHRALSVGADKMVRVWDVDNGKELFTFAWPLKDPSGHEDWFLSLSPDGRRVLLGGNGNAAVVLWDLEGGKEIRRFPGHPGGVHSVSFSADGRRALTAGVDHLIRLWDVDSGRELQTFSGHKQTVLSAVLSPDGRRVLSGSGDSTVRLWDVETGQELQRYSGQRGWVHGVAFSPDGRLALSGGGMEWGDGQVTSGSDWALRLWKLPEPGEGMVGAGGQSASKPDPLVTQPETPGGEPLSPAALVGRPAPLKGLRGWTVETRGHRGLVSALAYSPDGRWLVTAGEADGTVRLWEADSGRLARILIGPTAGPRAVAWSPDGKKLATGNWESVSIWDPTTGQQLRSLEALNPVAWSPDGKTLATGGTDRNTLRLWDPGSGQLLRTIENAPAVDRLAWSPDGKTLASGGTDKVVRLWSASGKSLRSLEGHTGGIVAVAWSPDGKTLATSGEWDNDLRFWEAESGKPLRTLPHPAMVFGVAWSPDGKSVATACWDLTVRLWEADTGRAVRTIQGLTAYPMPLAWSPDGKRLAVSGYEGSVRFWDAQSGELIRTRDGHQIQEDQRAVAWSPDGKTLATFGEGSVIQLWEAGTGRPLRSFEKFPGSALIVIAWAPNGRMVATGGWDGSVRVLGVESGRLQRTLGGPPGYVSAVAWSPDSKTLASGGTDKVVRLWDVETGKALQTLEGHSSTVATLAWSPDGGTLASGDGGGSVRVWKAASGELLRTLSLHKGAVGTLAWSPDGKILASGSYGSIQLSDAATGQVVKTIPYPGGDLAWLENGQALMAVCADRMVRSWDVKSGELTRTVRGLAAWGASSPDRRLVASASGGSAVRLWEADSGRLRWTLAPLANKESLTLSPDGHYRGPEGIEQRLVYVALTDRGLEMLTPEEFGKKYGWKNDPGKVKPAEK